MIGILAPDNGRKPHWNRVFWMNLRQLHYSPLSLLEMPW